MCSHVCWEMVYFLHLFSSLWPRFMSAYNNHSLPESYKNYMHLIFIDNTLNAYANLKWNAIAKSM